MRPARAPTRLPADGSPWPLNLTHICIAWGASFCDRDDTWIFYAVVMNQQRGVLSFAVNDQLQEVELEVSEECLQMRGGSGGGGGGILHQWPCLFVMRGRGQASR